MRKGQETSILHDQILVGDIIKIKAGMEIPVDGLILKSSGVFANESAMTGESKEVRKETFAQCKQRKTEKDSEFIFDKKKTLKVASIPSPVLLSGTQITTGEGWFVAIVVGKHSCSGKIAAKLE